MKYNGNPKLEEYHIKYRQEHREEINAKAREKNKRLEVKEYRKEYNKTTSANLSGFD